MNRRVVGEDRSRPVAVVQVEIDHQDPAIEAPRALRADRDGDVVEDAEAVGRGRDAQW